MRVSIRNQYVDSLKGLCIFLVIFGHCLQYGSGAVFLSDGEYWENLGMKFIYSFHMPLFMAISGYLFAFSLSKYGPVEVCRRIDRQKRNCGRMGIGTIIQE